MKDIKRYVIAVVLLIVPTLLLIASGLELLMYRTNLRFIYDVQGITQAQIDLVLDQARRQCVFSVFVASSNFVVVAISVFILMRGSWRAIIEHRISK